MLERIRNTLRRLPHWARTARAKTEAGIRWSIRTARDPKARDRAYCGMVFSAIIAFAAISTDYLITGGPNWNPGAFDLPRARYAEAVVQIALPADIEVPELPIVEAAPASFHNPRISADDLLGGPHRVLAAYRRGAEQGKPTFSTIAGNTELKPRFTAS